MIYVYHGKIILSGNINFEDNTAVGGGAMYLQLSNLYIASSSAITFKNNNIIALDHGEALYLDESKIYIIPNANVTFANNRTYNKGAMELSTLNLAYITLNRILSQNDPHKCFHHPWSEISNNESAYIKFTIILPEA